MRIVCVGGGPGALYVAVLLKRARPAWEIVVYERNQPDETFGFGVVFSEPTLSGLKAADPTTYEAMLAESERWDPIEVRRADATLRCHGQGFAAIARQRLLGILRREAEHVGVVLHFGVPIDPFNLPVADLVIAADGARSAIRKRFEEHFEPTFEVGAAKYIWFATTQRFECLTFLFEENSRGAFAVHAYPFASGASTFIVETDERTWRNAGLDGVAGPNAEDGRSLRYCEELFASHLGGHRLLANRSVWTNFRTVRTQSWHHERVVLLGDAAHTAHFSVGSGTKMALEDALALSTALCSEASVPAALARYEGERRPRVRKLQLSAGPSLVWWETFGQAMGQPLEPFMFRFLTRNFNVTRESLVKRDPSFVHHVEQWFSNAAGGGEGRAQDAAYAVRGLRLANRIVCEDSEHGSEARSSLVLAAPASYRSPSSVGAGSSHVKRGLLVDASQAASLDFSREDFDWLEVRLDGTRPPQELIETVRARWKGPLSARLVVGREPLDGLVSLARDAVQAGADVISINAAPDRQVSAILFADALRFPSATPLMISCPADLADTLLLSQRTDLCLTPRT